MQKALNNWRLPRKLFVAFSIIALMIAGLGVTAVVSTEIISTTSHQHTSRSLPTVRVLSNLLGQLREYRILMYSHMTALDAEEVASLEQRVTANRKAMDAELVALGRLEGPHLRTETDRLKTLLTALQDVNDRTLAVSRQGLRDDALFLIKDEGQTNSRAAIQHASRMIDLATDEARRSGAEADATSSRALIAMSTLAGLAAAVLVLIWWLANRTLSRPMTELTAATSMLAAGGDMAVPSVDRGDELGEIARAVEQFRLAALARQEMDHRLATEQAVVTDTLGKSLAALAQGDLTAEVVADFPPASATLKSNFNDALSRLREMIGAVSISTIGLRTGSQEIAQASEDLARRTEGSAASLEETSAALVQIDGRLKTSAEASAQTVIRADEALNTVTGGRAVAEEAVTAMERVSSSAKGIDQVIEGVDKIAFQTRVLAMNAAVEAGRAGDAGRGFAVVADLVSALAMRAEEEARRARDQLTLTQTDIVTAVDAVQRVDNALLTISEGVEEVHGLLGQMANDNQAQSTAISEISEISVAIGSMDQSTQQNAAMVEETSAAARNLTSAVASLAEQAALFRTGATAATRDVIPLSQGTRPRTYVSPVKPLPVAATAQATALAVEADEEDWSNF
ncbi:MAG TPA: methyl-accepting chemotaxis protein [Sphingobium sp.]|uniref:methyl-accepting chemotaxis protein n=1 Tax=Sphingobium sp. TaxID=1912891 RepID=UPI002ED29AF4